MPLRVPPFSQYQAPLFTLRGLWNAIPKEGDRFVAAEINWGSYPAGQGVQFQLSGNSPVALSQIVALTVDNARCGSDVQFVFADSGFVLQVPAHAQGCYPVFTNGLMLYAIALNASAADTTSINVHNSMPPTMTVQLTAQQSTAAVSGIALTNGTTPIVAAPTAGTLNGGVINVDMAAGAATQTTNIALQDGAGHTLWYNQVNIGANQVLTDAFSLGAVNVRFFNGLSLVVFANTIAAGAITANVYYTVP